MEELNYLRQDKKIPGKESFVTYVDFQVKDGTADMWLYDIFPGVQLMVVDFSSESCFRSGEKQNVIGIIAGRGGLNVRLTAGIISIWEKAILP